MTSVNSRVIARSSGLEVAVIGTAGSEHQFGLGFKAVGEDYIIYNEIDFIVVAVIGIAAAIAASSTRAH